MAKFTFLQSLTTNFDIVNVLRNLAVGLTKLSFSDNFNSKLITVTTTTASVEVVIANPFRGDIPLEWCVVDVENGAVGNLSRGPSSWTSKALYFVNDTSGTSTFKIRLFR